MIKCILLLTIFIFGGFSYDEKIVHQKKIEEKITNLQKALQKLNEERVNFAINKFNTIEENEKLIEFFMKENKAKETVLHIIASTKRDKEKIVSSVLNAFTGKDKKKKINRIFNERKSTQRNRFTYCFKKRI